MVSPPRPSASVLEAAQPQLTLICDGTRGDMAGREFTRVAQEALENLGLDYRVAHLDLNLTLQGPAQPAIYYRAAGDSHRGPLLVFTTRPLVSDWAVSGPWGLARPEIGTAIVNVRALSREAGLPGVLGRRVSHDRLHVRLIKVAAHEIGHLVGLTHCRENGCCMAPSPLLQSLDRRGTSPCPVCARKMQATTPLGPAPIPGLVWRYASRTHI